MTDNTSEIIRLLAGYQSDMVAELNSILHYWSAHTIDEKSGGFVGKIDNDNNVDFTAGKGVVLNSRILWTFSTAYRVLKHKSLLELSHRSFSYLSEKFKDQDYGGLFWLVNAQGDPLDTKKQIYAQAFGIYACSEYYRASGNPEARRWAIDLFELIESNSYDPIKGGYIDALSRNWKELDDVRLSEKDANEKKTMNTHLHILEGYANLYLIWPDELLRQRIVELLELFIDKMIDSQSKHLRLFFDEDWNSKSNLVSYGHDIEAAWLLLEAARVIDHPVLIKKLETVSVQIADTVLLEGLDTDGGLWYEYEPDNKHLIREKHWWPQAEAMLGFFNAWELTGNEKYLEASLRVWSFTQKHIIDAEKGEWFWGVRGDYSVMEGEDKVGIWKCPYHNARACLEIGQRIARRNN